MNRSNILEILMNDLIILEILMNIIILEILMNVKFAMSWLTSDHRLSFFEIIVLT